MKTYIILFLLISTTALSQNYHYALDEEPAAPDTENPSTPINLVASNITEITVDLSWTAATDNIGVVDYQIYNNGILMVASTGTNGTLYTLTGLTPDTAYNITVRARDVANNLSADSNPVVFSTQTSQYTSTRFLMMGDSYTFSMYYFEDQIEAQINASFPNETVEIVMMGSPGESINSYATGSIPNVDSFLATVEDIPTVQTFCVVMLGINDARVKLYDDLNQVEIDTKIANLNYILDAIEAKGFTPILLEAPFANFQPSTQFPDNLGPAYDDESKGTKPYNDNITIPTILSRTPEFAFADGQSYMQPYTLMYNGHPDYTGDGVHPSGAGYDHLKQAFVNTICRYIFTGEKPEKLIKDNGSFFGGQNLLSEIAYFNAYEVQPSEATNIQTLINTHGTVRLANGDFSNAPNITLNSNQSIYGHFDRATVYGGSITVAAGSRNVIIKSVDPTENIILGSGAAISNLRIEQLYYTSIIGTGFQLEDSKFIDLMNVKVNFDNSVTGYMRNCEFIRVMVQSVADHVIIKGNTTTPSYGNIEFSRNFLTGPGNEGNYDTLQTHTMIGVDAEAWDWYGTGGTSPLHFRNTGKLKVFNYQGYSSSAISPEFDVEADEFILQRRSVGSSNIPIIKDANYIYLEGSRNAPNATGTAFGLTGHHSGTVSTLNGSDVSATIIGADATVLSEVILGTQHTPIPNPIFETLPNPTGASWNTDRNGQADQSAFIQNLIDTNGIAELDAGVYYISQSLELNDGEGIVGKGTGQTAIVGITDNFPLIVVGDVVVANPQHDTNNRYILAHLTLQGGSHGFYIQPEGHDQNVFQITNNPIKSVIFRNQQFGILFDLIYAYDNNFLNEVSFVDCNVGFGQIPAPTIGNTECYVDKTVFYKCQFINNRTALSLPTVRANNMNAWVDCNFDGNDVAIYQNNANGMYIANSVFKNHKGTAVLTGNAPYSLYGCTFENNTTTALFGGSRIYGDGNLFNDSINFFSDTDTNKYVYLWNSTINSTVNKNIINRGYFVNTTVTNNIALSNLMVEVVGGNILTILGGTSTPYPQLLVKQ